MNVSDESQRARFLGVARDEHWVMERRAIDLHIEEMEHVRPEALMCVSSEGLVLGATVISPDASASEITSWALGCMLAPMVGKPRRPEAVTLAGGKLKPLAKALEPLGISVDVQSEPSPLVDELISLLESNLSHGIPPYLVEPGIKPETLAEFFASAAGFYKLKPWKLFEYETPLRVSFQIKKKVTYYAIVMGVLGENLGLTLYRSADDLLELLDCDEEESLEIASKTWSLSFSNESFDSIGLAAQEECQSNEWTLAGDSYYPSAMVIDQKGKQSIRRPTRDEFVQLTTVTLALTDFLAAHKKQIKAQEGFMQETIAVTVAGKQIAVDVVAPAPEFFVMDDEEDEDEGR